MPLNRIHIGQTVAGTGKKYEELTDRFWQWTLSSPLPRNELARGSGTITGNDQPFSDVFFAGGYHDTIPSLQNTKPVREAALSGKKAILVMVIGSHIGTEEHPQATATGSNIGDESEGVISNRRDTFLEYKLDDEDIQQVKNLDFIHHRDAGRIELPPNSVIPQLDGKSIGGLHAGLWGCFELPQGKHKLMLNFQGASPHYPPKTNTEKIFRTAARYELTLT